MVLIRNTLLAIYATLGALSFMVVAQYPFSALYFIILVYGYFKFKKYLDEQQT